MGSLFNEWIKLFDEKNFQNIQDEPQGLRAVTMLFVTIQKEFQRVETSLSEKLKSYKLALQSNDGFDKVKSVEETASPFGSYKENSKRSANEINRNNKTLLKSPTIDRKRRTNMRKFRKPLSLSGMLQPKLIETLSTPKKNNSSRKSVPGSDDDIFDSSVIDMTPNVEVSKRLRTTMNSQKKKTHSEISSSSKTLTQMFSGVNDPPEDNEKKDETTMMDIEEILERVESAANNDPLVEESPSSATSVLKNMRISDSFIEEYDKIPERKKEPEKPFVYKETVRGNERKKLKGWSCKECEHFYKGMKLSEEELEKKMNVCSKHRSKFKPDEETVPGYWDLSIPSTPEDEKSTPPSSPETSQNNLNESTIFCFYK